MPGHHFRRNQLQPPPDPHRSPCVSADDGPPSGTGPRGARSLPALPGAHPRTLASKGCPSPPTPEIQVVSSQALTARGPWACHAWPLRFVPLLGRVGPRLILSQGFGWETLCGVRLWLVRQRVTRATAGGTGLGAETTAAVVTRGLYSPWEA